MKLSRAVAAMLAFAAILPAPAPASAQPFPRETPEGHYVVMVYAAWAQTTNQGEFYLDPGGVYRDVWNELTGRWSFDPATRRVRFHDGAYQDATVEFDPALHGRGALKITWPGIDPVWAYREPTPVGKGAPPLKQPTPKPAKKQEAEPGKKQPPNEESFRALLERLRAQWAAAETPGEKGTVLMELAKVMKLDPSNGEALLVGGDFYLDLEDYKLAESTAKAVLELDQRPRVQSDAYRLLGLVYESTNRMDDAIAAYRASAILTSPGTPVRSLALVFLAVALGAVEKHTEAETVLREAVAADPTSSSAHGELGNALARQGKNAEAAAAYRIALELNPEDEGAKGNLEIVQERMKTGRN